MALETRTYQKENTTKIRGLIKESIQDIYNSRFLAMQITKRDIKARYKQSYLGLLWEFITPLTTAFVWIFLNSTGTIKLTDTGMHMRCLLFQGL